MKILFVTLSNIGDCILTLPVLDVLREKYPQAQITCLVPERPKEIFIDNPAVARVVVFDKHAKLSDKIKLFFSLSKEKFDLVIDLRNSFFGAFLPAKKRSLFSGPLRRIPGKFKHMRDRHLFRAFGYDYPAQRQYRSLNIKSGDEDYIKEVLGRQSAAGSKLIVVAPGAKSQVKCWDKQNFRQLCRTLIAAGYPVVLVGDKSDQDICSYILRDFEQPIIDLCAKTDFSQLAALLKQAHLLISNDSAVMHLASYLNIPVGAIFGPTDEEKYAPWSEKSIVIKKDIFCRPCAKAICRFVAGQCLASIKPADVLAQIQPLLEDQVSGPVSQNAGRQIINTTAPGRYRRILIARTDRLGDVILSTPAVRALRQKFPQSYMAMMVSAYAKDVVEGNPDLDAVIVFDKEGKDRGLAATFKFVWELRKNKFDLAVVLHPTVRVHLLMFLSRIPWRLGYDRKFKFLLTDSIPHTKQSGEKHESEYALDMARYLGADTRNTSLFVPVKQEAENWADVLFMEEGISREDKLLVIHPAASCISKIWPAENFAQVADRLSQKHGFKVCIIAGPKDISKAEQVVRKMQVPALNLAGKTTVSQLASLIRRAQLFVSTDSGPVHIASAFSVPQVTIFGRSQAGLSPVRWGAKGQQIRILHKSVGCTACLAHDCLREFACIKSITVEDVLEAAEDLISGS
jgi:heptosyltransferase II